MRALLSAGLLIAATVSSALGQGAIVVGNVDLPKTKSAPLMTKRYEIVSKAGVLAPNPPLAVVYLEGKFPPAADQPVHQIAQTNYNFVPTLLPIQVGSKVEFPNLDDAFHNIFSFSPAKRFDLGRYRPEDRPTPFQVFDKPGLVTLRCDIHEHMRALILVLDTPYFVTTDPQGDFELKNLPEGDFMLRAWLSSKSTLEQPVHLKKGSTTKVIFSPTASKRDGSSK